MSLPDYLAFIDESGSEGDPNKLGGFEFLSLVAVVVRRRNAQCLTDVWERLARYEKKPPAWRWRGFKDTNSDAMKYLAAELLSVQPFQFAAVIAHKPGLIALDHAAKHGSLYFFAAQLLVERISWIVRDGQEASTESDGRVRIIFSERKNTAYDQLLSYIRFVMEDRGSHRSNTEWQHIDLNQITKVAHHTCGPLAAPDFVAGSIASALEMNRKHGVVDDRFMVPLASRCYRPRPPKAGASLGNGLKIYPQEAVQELMPQDRFRWVRTHYTTKR